MTSYKIERFNECCPGYLNISGKCEKGYIFCKTASTCCIAKEKRLLNLSLQWIYLLFFPTQNIRTKLNNQKQIQDTVDNYFGFVYLKKIMFY